MRRRSTRISPLLLLLGALVASSCQSAESVNCDDGSICAAGLVCAPAGGCAQAEQLSACSDKVDGDMCSLALGDGFCQADVCVVAQCGNGKVDLGEFCDDGNDVNEDECPNDCSLTSCGDGIVQAGEECDQGAANANDRACTATCRVASCGDGLREVGREDCDAGNANADNSACTSSCDSNMCGDGMMWSGVEACDDGNAVSGDGCRDDCRKIELCGDGILDSGESCDDSNLNRVDGCDACALTTWNYAAILGAPPEDSVFNNAGLIVDTSGNLFIADQTNNMIRKVDAQTGAITTIAGTGIRGAAGDGGPATNAQLSGPVDLVLDGIDNLFIADRGNNRVRRVDVYTGVITTVAGNGTSGFGGDGGPGTSAQLRNPAGVALNGVGDLFIADDSNHRVRRVDAQTGTITTIAGTGASTFGGDDGPAIDAQIAYPSDVAFDEGGNLLIADRSNNRIRKVDTQTGIITTIAGTGSYGFGGDDGPAVSAQLAFPRGLAVDGAGNLLITDTSNYRIRRVDGQTGTITTVAGDGTRGSAGDGGLAINAQLNTLRGAGIDGAGNLLIVETSRIRRVDAQTGIITTIVGTTTAGGDGDDGAASSAAIGAPIGVALDSLGNLFIAGSQVIRRIDAQTGIITTVAGNGSYGDDGDDGPATSAQLGDLRGVAVDGAGNIFTVDSEHHRVRRVDSQTGIITTVAGTGTSGLSGDGGPAISAQLDYPSGIAIDGADNLFIAASSRVRRVDAQTGIITRVAGSTYGFSGDGGPAISAQLGATGVAVDSAGNLFIADTNNQRIRRVDAQTGNISTIAGNGNEGSGGDGGPATSAEFAFPVGVAVDGVGNVFTTDLDSRRIRRIDPQTGIITTYAGGGPGGSRGDGGPATNGTLNYSEGVAVDAQGNLFIADTGDGRIRRVDAQTGTITTPAGEVFPLGMGLAPNAKLSTPETIVLADTTTFFAGGVIGMVFALNTQDMQLDAVIGRAQSSSTGTGDRARYQASSFGDVGGVAYNAADKLIYLSETTSNRIHAVSIDDPTNGVLAGDPDTWVIETLAGAAGTYGHLDGLASVAEFREPTGLHFNGTTRLLYIADTGNHVIRSIDVDTGIVSTVAGSAYARGFAGDGGPATDSLLFDPSALTECPNGDLFIADTGTNRVRRIDFQTGDISTVIGVGVAGSSGEGVPARSFPVDVPRGLTCDTFGNLFVTSRKVIRLLAADDNGLVDGSGPVQTIFGAEPRDIFPEPVTNCLTDLAVTVDDSGATVVQAVDSCTGMLIELSKGALGGAAP